MPGMESILSFCRALSSTKADIITIQKATATIATEYRLGRVDIDISIREGFTPNAGTKYLTLFQNPNYTEYEEPFDFRFRVEREGEILARLYPLKGSVYTDDEKHELELIANISFFYFGRIRFADVVEKSAMTQYLTGLPNSGGYIAKAVPIFKAHRAGNYDGYFFNLKGFGLMGKKYGIKQGDDMIRQYAAKLADFIGSDEIVGHLGGDNFVAMIKKSRYDEFTKLLSGVPVTTIKNGQSTVVKLAATVGVWHIPGESTDAGDLIGLPGVAMNAAKNVLHQPLCVVSDRLLQQVAEQKRVLDRFPSAMRKEEFLVYYQPKVDSRSNTLVGAEALVRWNHKGEMISPGAFIPVLEREGEIGKLDLYVLEHTCMDIRRWLDAGIAPVQVSVNISRKDIADATLASQIIEIIGKYEINHRYIQIEVTETTDEAEHGLMTEFLNKLREHDISTAIDDFGSGYSSLSTLRNFNISMLKIDRSFINNETFSKNDEIILTDIIHMAERLGIEVITEGVERKDQLDFINKVGCFLIQDFYYDKPLPVDEFTERLQNKSYTK